MLGRICSVAEGQKILGASAEFNRHMRINIGYVKNADGSLTVDVLWQKT
jgi:hypothetical protein